MSFTFGGPAHPQIEEADDNPDLDFQNLQIDEYHLQVTVVGVAAGAQALQVAAGGVAAGAQTLQVAAGAVAAGAGFAAGAGAQAVNFPSVNYFNTPLYTPARMGFDDFMNEAKPCLTFGGASFLSCGPTSNALKTLMSKCHLQYLLMLDTHVVNNDNNPAKIYDVNQFLFETFEDVLHPTRMVMFRIYKNFRDYIFKPVFLNVYATSLNIVPKALINEPMKAELFTVWLTCTV
jgi:hypothetical protein